ncbi:isochorismatase family cysteine hydrolase [Parvibaculum sp.]|uniref:cysteine hydrolase family protein n=1 Tax=Parvibaculum sp. TaxID=2024848 RepID=UPI002B854005|nr:isochorismatase family cysteine hydrolase [Parvibaculum sp.]HUD51965.1 isochorismatase family cysteine hydrolase [Parvibaculum sp.]
MPSEGIALRDPPVEADRLPPMIVPSRTALVIVDAQEDFIGPTGVHARLGFDMSAVEAPLANVVRLAEAARRAGATVVFPRVVTTPETDSEALKLLARRKGRSENSIAICREGTPGADYYGIRPQEGDIEIAKVLFSSFQGTDLEQQLKAKGVDTLVMTGFTTDCCVDCTARDAFHRNFSVFVVVDACAAFGDGLHVGALNGLAKNCALLVETDSVVKAWSGT